VPRFDGDPDETLGLVPERVHEVPIAELGLPQRKLAVDFPVQNSAFFAVARPIQSLETLVVLADCEKVFASSHDLALACSAHLTDERVVAEANIVGFSKHEVAIGFLNLDGQLVDVEVVVFAQRFQSEQQDVIQKRILLEQFGVLRCVWLHFNLLHSVEFKAGIPPVFLPLLYAQMTFLSSQTGKFGNFVNRNDKICLKIRRVIFPLLTKEGAGGGSSLLVPFECSLT